MSDVHTGILIFAAVYMLFWGSITKITGPGVAMGMVSWIIAKIAPIGCAIVMLFTVYARLMGWAP